MTNSVKKTLNFIIITDINYIPVLISIAVININYIFIELMNVIT